MAAGVLGASAAGQTRPAIYVVPAYGSFPADGAGAVGLYVPGKGARVSRAAAIAAIRRGKVRPRFNVPRSGPSQPAVYNEAPTAKEHQV